MRVARGSARGVTREKQHAERGGDEGTGAGSAVCYGAVVVRSERGVCEKVRQCMRRWCGGVRQCMRWMRSSTCVAELEAVCKQETKKRVMLQAAKAKCYMSAGARTEREGERCAGVPATAVACERVVRQQNGENPARPSEPGSDDERGVRITQNPEIQETAIKT